MSVKRYRKKPVVIEAMQLIPGTDNYKDVCDWITSTDGLTGQDHRPRAVVANPGYGVLIHTLEGDMKASSGDWVIRGVKDEFYPCKPDIFDATYEAVEEGSSDNPFLVTRTDGRAFGSP